MRKIIIVFVFCFLFIFVNVVHAQEVIDDFTVEIKINQDSSISVTEKISYNFGETRKHGIYRDIPYKYKARGGTFKLRFSDIEVTYNNGKPVNFVVSNQSGNKHIKIGDANKYVSGQQQYIIKYTVKRAINYFDTHDELYWNATGNEWSVDIKQSRINLILPQSSLESDLRTQCFAGPEGSQDECLSTRYEYAGIGQVKGITFINDLLTDREGMTIVIGVPKGVIAKPTIFQNLLYIIKDNWILSLPFLILMLMYHLWHTRGRDPRGRGTIIAEFEAPDNLSPAEVGAIIDETVHKHDVSAEIINLAIKGYIKITCVSKDKKIFKSTDYILEKLKSADDLVLKHEKRLLDALFEKENVKASIKDIQKAMADKGVDKDSLAYKILTRIIKLNPEIKEEAETKNLDVVKLSDLKSTFYQDWAKIKKDIYQSIVDKGYFSKNPNKVRGMYIVIGIAILFLSWVFGIFFGFLGVFSSVVSAIIVMIFGYFMPAKTKKGALAREHILGLKEYLRVAEKDRIKFHNAPEKNPKRFEDLLPYAMVLKVEKEWANQFENIYDKEPEWYSNSGNGHFGALALANSLHVFQTKANSTLASAPSSASSGGSGFSGGSSGGGFGGGGGGSW